MLTYLKYIPLENNGLYEWISIEYNNHNSGDTVPWPFYDTLISRYKLMPSLEHKQKWATKMIKDPEAKLYD